MSEALYYEVHVTLEPDFYRVAKADNFARLSEFRRAKLVMRREDGTETEARDDMFYSTRSNTLQDATRRTITFCNNLKEHDFKIRRYKIETAVIDSKIEDSFVLGVGNVLV